MSMGTRRKRQRQHELWVAAADLPATAAHPFYQRLNALLDEHGFDAFVERVCQPFYAATMGRPSVAPGIYFRLLLLGYFEGVDSERGIAWRAADSLAIRRFLRIALDEPVPDHSTISRTRRLIDVETHRAVFTWVQQRLGESSLLKGKTVAIDATTLEANAAMRSIVRRDTGENYQAFLTRLAETSGIKTPSRAALARLDRKRKKRTSNKDWTSPTDPDAKVTKMKDGRTHLAHKAEHAVDLETGAIVAVTVQGADQGDTTTIDQTLGAAVDQLTAVADATDVDVETAPEVVADKGYHSRRTVLELETNGFRTYISEPDRGPQRWKRQADARAAVYANRRRIHGDRGLRLLRRRGEYVERSFAHVYDTGGMRRTHLRGHTNILKRLLIHASAFNLGLMMRSLIGIGTPRGLQGRLAAVIALLVAVWHIVTNAANTDFVRRPHHGRSMNAVNVFGPQMVAG
jgi:transposase